MSGISDNNLKSVTIKITGGATADDKLELIRQYDHTDPQSKTFENSYTTGDIWEYVQNNDGSYRTQNTNITIRNDGTDTITLTGVASKEAYAEILKYIQPFNNSGAGVSKGLEIEYIATDTSNNVSTISSVTFNGELALSPDLTLTDIDSDNMQSATVTISEGARPDDQLNLIDDLFTVDGSGKVIRTSDNSDTGITVNDSNPGTLIFTGTAPKETYEEILKAISLANPSTNPDGTTGPNLIVNGGFEDETILPGVTAATPDLNGIPAGTINSVSYDNEIVGWKTDNDDITLTEHTDITIGNPVIAPHSSSNKSGNSIALEQQSNIYQDVDTSSSDTFILSFSIALNSETRNSNSINMEIYWNNQLLDAITDHELMDSIGYVSFKYEVEATSDTTRLEFRNSSLVGQEFTFADNVELYAVDQTDLGNRTVEYKATDDSGLESDIANLTIVESQPPKAKDDAITTDEDTSVTFTIADLLANDTDKEDGQPEFNGIYKDPDKGTLVDNGDGTFTYTPDAEFSGSDAIIYSVIDSDGNTNTARINVTVNEVNEGPEVDNEAPKPADDLFTMDEYDTLTFSIADLLANDTDVQDGVPQFNGFVTDPAVGTLTDNGDGTFTYDHGPNYQGSDTFQYEVIDSDGNTSTADVFITVNDINLAPIADDNTVQVGLDTPTPISITDLATDPDDSNTFGSGSITILDREIFDDGNNGTRTSYRLDHGTFSTHKVHGFGTYTPDPGFYGTDTFTYTVVDEDGAVSNEATVTINVIPLKANTITLKEDEILEATGNVLDNDISPTGQPLELTHFNGQALVNGTLEIIDKDYGTITVNSDGSYIYTLDNDSPKVQQLKEGDTFGIQSNWNYTATDGQDSYTIGFKRLIEGTDDDIVANPDTNNVQEDVTLATSGNLLTNDETPDSSSKRDIYVKSVGAEDSAVGNPANGTTVIHGTYGDLRVYKNGHYTYTLRNNDPNVQALNEGDVVQDVFEYTASDNRTEDTSTLTINVSGSGSGGGTLPGGNQQPNAADDILDTNEDTPLTFSVADLLANDTDLEDGQPQFDKILAQPAYGTLVDNGDGTFTYTPPENYFGPDTIAYQVIDSNGSVEAANLDINVISVNDNPTLNDTNATTKEDKSVTINLDLHKSKDIDGTVDRSTIEIIEQPKFGTITVNNNAHAVYTPNPDFNGIDTFSYTIKDNEGGVSNIATTTVTVTPVGEVYVAQPVPIAQGLDIMDEDSDELQAAKVTLEVGFEDDGIVLNDTLFFIDTNTHEVISISTLSGTGIFLEGHGTDQLSFSGFASLQTYEDVIQSLNLVSFSDNPIEATRSVGISLTDDQGITSNEEKASVNLIVDGTIDETANYELPDGTLVGTDDDNIINGIDNHKFDGLGGNDTITGTDGDDTIDGGAGADIIISGAGNDTIVFSDLNSSTDASHDTIVDFTQGEDVIDLTSIGTIQNISDLEITYNGSTDVTTVSDVGSDFSFELHGEFNLTGSDFKFDA
jgi:VCBS repeat-containing protein